MRKYKVVFCFIDKDGYIETYNDGMEKYHIEEVQAYNGGEAMDKLREKFTAKKPEIISVTVVEEQNERVI